MSSRRAQPAPPPKPWRVNAYVNGRSVGFHYEFDKLENISSNPTNVSFTSGCPYPTLVRCYTEANGGGYMSAANFAANSRENFNVGAFKSWEVLRR
ncbi:hypothetical protein B0J18DRAFT_491434 [Chaetomium sp. MPI-SDFR-AT-0129]|nr:hypothetical protein B0J18DRAFT_491434 [Chaetomium sp. MPI-SDFR-AT-0129]